MAEPRPAAGPGQPRGGTGWRVWLIVAILAPAFVLMLLGIFDPHGSWRPISSLFAPPEDGSWAAVSINGRAVPPEDYHLWVRDGAIAGGRDGCNDWSYSDDPPDPSGGRRIFTTLAACPDDQPGPGAYRTLVNLGRFELIGENVLRLSAPGHQAVFRRCRWQWVRGPAPRSAAERVCSTVGDEASD